MNQNKEETRCEICSKKFKGKGAKTRHLRKDHPLEYEAIMERDLRAEYQENLEKYGGEYDEKFIQSRILVGKYNLYHLHNRIDDAIEQVRQEILLYFKEFEAASYEPFEIGFDPVDDAKLVASNCLGGFLLTLNKKYKEQIPQPILVKIEEMVEDIKKSIPNLMQKGLIIEIPTIRKKEEIRCVFCGKVTTSRGGLSNHLRTTHPAEYVTQLEFELNNFERRLQSLLGRKPVSVLRAGKEIQQESSGVKITITVKDFSMESDFETLEFLEESHDYLKENAQKFSEEIYTHLLNLMTYDIAQLRKTISSRQKIIGENLTTYHFDIETKEYLVTKYQDLIKEWKVKRANVAV